MLKSEVRSLLVSGGDIDGNADDAAADDDEEDAVHDQIDNAGYGELDAMTLAPMTMSLMVTCMVCVAMWGSVLT